MTLHPARQVDPDQGQRRVRALVRALVLLLVAAGLALAVVLPFAHWSVHWSLLEYILPWLLHPYSGFLPLTLALWLLFTVPSALRSLAGVRRGGSPRPGPSAPVTTAQPTAPPRTSPADEERLSIPAVTFRQMGAGHRRELAEALDIPWRDALIHDHQGWAVACLEAAQRRAADPRR